MLPIYYFFPQVSCTSEADHDAWIRTTTKKKGIPTGIRTPAQDFMDYLAETSADDYGASPLHWWANTGKSRYPELAAVARDLLSICPTSAPAERLFSAGNAVVSYRRNRLKAKTIEALVGVRCWLSHDNKRWYDVAVEDSDDKE